MSHYDDDERVLEGTAKHLKAMRQYRNLDSGFKEILDIEKERGSEFTKALGENAGRIDSFSKYQSADEDTRKISRENGMVEANSDSWTATTHSDAIDLCPSDQIALEDMDNKKPAKKK